MSAPATRHEHGDTLRSAAPTGNAALWRLQKLDKEYRRIMSQKPPRIDYLERFGLKTRDTLQWEGFERAYQEGSERLRLLFTGPSPCASFHAELLDRLEHGLAEHANATGIATTAQQQSASTNADGTKK